MSEATIFAAALDRSDPVDRAAFLAEACAGDDRLRRRVEALLKAHAEPDEILDAPPRESGTAEYAPITEKPGTVIGHYKLMEQIGEGGFGLVFVAEQTEPVRRKVALKIIKPGMDSKSVIARFEAERQALAMMDHQNIAKVHDAGTTDSGRPYFVMELVHGVPITEYCDANKLTPRQRLELFVPVCHAIQHAHQKGIIHRDIKPSNVLVTMYDDKPVPKVIDFGVAKAIEQRLTERTVYTQFGTLVGTFEYMSPEQADLNAFGVDTRSDIYTLGVLLYELLTGGTPLERQRLREAAFDEIRRLIKEEEPPRPSVRLSTSGTLAKVAAARQIDPAKLSRLVRGELDWMVMKCLEKDRMRRYETANALARDIQRYLADEQVEACPPSLGYRLRKTVRRHKAALAVAGMVLFFLVLMGGGAGWTMRDREARQAKLTSQATHILEEVAARQAEQKWPEALAAARRAEALLVGGGGNAALEQQVQAVLADLNLVRRLEEVRLEMGGQTPVQGDRAYAAAFRDGGLDLDALTEAAAAQQLRARVRVTPALATALEQWYMCRLFAENEPGAQALGAVLQRIDPDPLRQQVRAAISRKDFKGMENLATSAALDRQPPVTLFLVGVSLCLESKTPEQGIAVLRKAQFLYPGDLWINVGLGFSLQKLGAAHRDEALGCFRAALALRPDIAWNWLHVGNALRAQNKPDEAIAYYRKTIELDPNNAHAHNGLGNTLREQKKLDEAVVSLNKAIELDPKNATAHHNLGIALGAQKKFDESVSCYRKAIELNPNNHWSHYGLGNGLRELKRLDEAIACYKKAIELEPSNADAHHNLGNVLRDQKKFDEAGACFQKAIELRPKFISAHLNLGRVIRDQNKLDEAMAAFSKAVTIDPNNAEAHNSVGHILRLQKKLDEAVAAYRKAIELNPTYSSPHYNLGLALYAQKKVDEAVACYRKAIALDPDNPAPYHRPHFHLGLALVHEKKLDEAIPLFRRAVELNPKLTEAHTHLAWYLATAADPMLRDPKTALVHARKALELQPKTANNWSNLGVALLRTGDAKAAVEAFEKADALTKDGDHQHRFFLAMAYGLCGADDKARQAYEQGALWLTKNQPDNEEFRRFRAEAAAALMIEANTTPK